jgi:hypothetical protein
MHQESFNLTHQVSHTADPITSKDAERKVTANGQRKSNNQRVAWLVARYPGKTASELWHLYETEVPVSFEESETGPKDIYEIRRRLSDMNGIHVRRGTKEEARLGLLKNRESIWWPK